MSEQEDHVIDLMEALERSAAEAKKKRMADALDRHDADRHDLLATDDPVALACMWCQS